MKFISGPIMSSEKLPKETEYHSSYLGILCFAGKKTISRMMKMEFGYKPVVSV